ncbi:hypothetical protein [Pelagibius sp. Alg239-R121]|uniref:hypothetical protein n=1 Tax=Pelagibius sp. Alg239-R121 TaxID=2993448 RepID=UPI0024A6917A|nr:hypothetical protein [Pelagibius sp. Alg239-R121]
MAISLNEFDLGRDREIWYPNLQTCLGFTVVLDDGTLLGTHMTAGTTLRVIQYTCEYFEQQRGAANILSMLLIGNISDWNTHRESLLRTGGNLRETLRAAMNTDCVIYQYDSVCAESGGIGAAAHLRHKGGAHPYPDVELVKEGDWSFFMNFDPGHAAVQNLEIKHVYVPSILAAQAGAIHGVQAPQIVRMVRATGDKTAIEEGEMERT